MQICLIIKLQPNEIIAAQRHFPTVFVTQPTNRNLEIKVLLNQLCCEDFAEFSRTRSG